MNSTCLPVIDQLKLNFEQRPEILPAFKKRVTGRSQECFENYSAFMESFIDDIYFKVGCQKTFIAISKHLKNAKHPSSASFVDILNQE